MIEAFLIPSLAVLILLSWGIDYINGFHDTANSIATVVSTGVLPGRYALVMSATLNFAGALAGTSVATTIAKGIADSQRALSGSSQARCTSGASSGRNARSVTTPSVSVGGAARVQRGLDASGHEMEHRPALHGDRRAGMPGQHEHRGVIRRLIAPPASHEIYREVSPSYVARWQRAGGVPPVIRAVIFVGPVIQAQGCLVFNAAPAGRTVLP